jgi:hypothetical protein
MQILVGMSKSQYRLNTILKQNIFIILTITLCLIKYKIAIYFIDNFKKGSIQKNYIIKKEKKMESIQTKYKVDVEKKNIVIDIE